MHEEKRRSDWSEKFREIERRHLEILFFYQETYFLVAFWAHHGRQVQLCEGRHGIYKSPAGKKKQDIVNEIRIFLFYF